MASGTAVPPPPSFDEVSPLFDIWPRGEPLIRVYDGYYRATEFNPGTNPPQVSARFSFFADERGSVVPILYGSDREDGAISETIFHDVPVRGGLRSVQESRLERAMLVTLASRRDLRLVQLLGHGLRRLQLRAGDLTDTESDQYPATVGWARALHGGFPDADGLVWMSRQFNAAKAVALFGHRVRQDDLEELTAPVPLRMGEGRRRLEQAANEAGILIL